MQRFSWQSAGSVSQAASLTKTTVADAMLGEADAVVLKAGGIDLIDLMKENLLAPSRVVNLRDVPGTRQDHRGRCRRRHRRIGHAGADRVASAAAATLHRAGRCGR